MARSGAATKEKLLDAAEALVFDHGFSATSLDKVIALAGVTKGAFFHHFERKAELGRDQASLDPRRSRFQSARGGESPNVIGGRADED